MISKKIFTTTIITSLIGLASAVPFAFANHSWGGYHWARQSNPFSINLGDNVSIEWDSYLATTAADWSKSSVLDAVVVSSNKNPKTCKPTPGRVEVCNARYGNNGWLGIASIWLNGGHIAQGTVKMNDTYFANAAYNTPEWRNLVMCQEVGHTFGLDHQDENFTNPNLDTCMDYTNNPGSNQHPNLHDYAMLEQIYAHLDTTTTIGQTTAGKGFSDTDLLDVKDFGKEIRTSANGRASVFEKNLGNDNKVLTHVFWTEARNHTHAE
jgi:hypothetical protein